MCCFLCGRLPWLLGCDYLGQDWLGVMLLEGGEWRPLNHILQKQGVWWVWIFWWCTHGRGRGVPYFMSYGMVVSILPVLVVFLVMVVVSMNFAG